MLCFLQSGDFWIKIVFFVINPALSCPIARRIFWTLTLPWANWIAFRISNHFLNLNKNLKFLGETFSKIKAWPWRGWPAWGPRGSYQRQPLSAKLQQINDKLSALQLYHVRACYFSCFWKLHIIRNVIVEIMSTNTNILHSALKIASSK